MPCFRSPPRLRLLHRDLENLLLTLHGKGRKDRKVPFSFDIQKALIRYQARKDGPLFLPRPVLIGKLSRDLLMSMVYVRKAQPEVFTFKDLAVWSTKLPDVNFAVLPPSNTRPNPLATEDLVYASVFAPGAVCALERDRGKLIWRRELGRYANASVYLQGGKLFAKTSNTLFALRPECGEPLWSFCPYGSDGESIYSSPSVTEDRVYIGDRTGYLHCLDATSGRTIWRQRTNRARNHDVNSTPVLMNGLVIVTTNAKTIVAYKARSGKLAWKQNLDGPSTFGPLVHNGSVVAVSDSLYLFSRTGNLQRRFSWKGEKVYQADSTPRNIVVTFWPNSASRTTESPAKTQPSKLALLVVKSGMQRTTTFVEFCASLRYAPTTQLLYLSHLTGINLMNRENGTLLCRLKTNRDLRNNGVALVDVRNNTIYALTGDGRVHALRHPFLATQGL